MTTIEAGEVDWIELDWFGSAGIVMAVNKPFQNIDMIICLFVRFFLLSILLTFHFSRFDSIQFNSVFPSFEYVLRMYNVHTILYCIILHSRTKSSHTHIEMNV